jgi:N-acetylneuraminate lyase
MPFKIEHPLHGLVVAAHTPFHANGSLNLATVEKQAAHFLAHKLSTTFIGGTTGECSSLTRDERLGLAERWMAVTRGTALRVVVHVGGNCLEDAKALAAQAQQVGANAISALAPCYFKPRDVAALVDCMAAIASAAPALSFYYYEIPTMTGVTLSPSEFLARASEKIPNLAGLKFTSSNLMEYQLCRNFRDGAFDVPFGFDEMLLGALALGAKGAVGSTYNFAAPLYQRLIAAFISGDVAAAREEQMRSVQLIQLLVSFGFMSATKAVMEMLGVPVGPARLPNGILTAEQRNELRRKLEEFGFFKWITTRAIDTPGARL